MGILGGLRKQQEPQPATTGRSDDTTTPSPQNEKSSNPTKKWNLGILSDPLTDEVPGKSAFWRIRTRSTNGLQGLSFSSQRRTTATSRSVYSMRAHEHRPLPSHQRTAHHEVRLAALVIRHGHGNLRRSAQKMGSSFWTLSRRTRQMTLSTGSNYVEMLR